MLLPTETPDPTGDIPPKSMDRFGFCPVPTEGKEEEDEVEEEAADEGAAGVPEDIPWFTKAATLLRMSLQTEQG